MKKTYATPTLTTSGSVTRETLGGPSGGAEFIKEPLTAGRLGYYL